MNASWREIVLRRGEAARLSADLTDPELGEVPFRVSQGGVNRYAALPVERVHEYVLEAHQDLSLAIPDSAGLSIKSAGWCWPIAKPLRWLFSPSVIDDAFGGALSVYPIGGRSAQRKLRTTFRTLYSLGVGPLRAYPEQHRSIVLGPDDAPAAPWKPARAEKSPRIAVVVHLHYAELWPDFEARLRAMQRPFALIVTLTSENPGLRNRIASVFPGSVVRVVANRGFDIGPFIELLRSGELDGFDLVCKLHGKKSVRYGRPTLIGTLWRWHLIAELIGSADQVDRIVDVFDADPKLGMIGAAQFRIPNERFPAEEAWRANREQTLTLAGKLGISAADFKLDFFAGTMFWARPAALKRIAEAAGDPASWLSPKDQPVDGLLEHALERVFATGVLASGYTVASAPQFIE